MTNIEALKSLYKALGGDEDNFTAITIPEAISLIATVAATATAAELPTVKAADNGKVLTVVDGKWAKASLPE